MNALTFENVEPDPLHRREDGPLRAFEQPGGPGVRDVGQELEPLVAERRDPLGGLVERDSAGRRWC